MPHQRSRHLLPQALKRLKLWPVLGVLGPRQVGKSTLLRDLLANELASVAYLTLDLKELQDRANRAPDSFLAERREMKQVKTLILDEVQKAPPLFDAVKADVDARRIPGKYILSGSTEFSRKTGIREALTGRIGILRLYPMTVSECIQGSFTAPWTGKIPDAPTSTEAERAAYLERGGMPGICFLRSAEERAASFETWLDTSCFRDLQQIRSGRIDGQIARDILSTIATLEVPTLAEIASRLRMDARRIRVHLEALQALFILHRIDPHPAGVGKEEYLIFDSGVANHLGASLHQRLRIWAINECIAQHEYSGTFPLRLRYYRSPKKSRLDLVIEQGKRTVGCLLTDEASPGPYVLRTAKAFLKHLPGAEVWIVAPCTEVQLIEKKVRVIPMNRLC